MSSLTRVLPALLLFWLAGTARATVDQEVTFMDFFIHVDVASQVDLGELHDYLETGRILLQGSSYDQDVPCCTEIRELSFSTFGSPGDGFDVIDTATEFDTIRFLLPEGGYLVQTLTVCTSGESTVELGYPLYGCGPLDENVFFLTLDTPLETRPKTLAHEVGHNKGLGHRNTDPSALMSTGVSTSVAPKSGLTLYECHAFRMDATTSGSCTCIDMTGPPEDSFIGATAGLPCSPPADGFCRGTGLCEVPPFVPGGETLFLTLPFGSGPPQTLYTRPNRPSIHTSPTFVGDLGDEVSALAYSAERDMLFGIGPGPGNDRLLRIDPLTAYALEIAVLDRTGIHGLTYDPLQNVLYAADRAAGILLAIDPDAGSVAEIGPTGLEIDDLAFDAVAGRLFAAAAPLGGGGDGLYELDEANGTPTLQRGFVDAKALEFDPATGRVLAISSSFLESHSVPTAHSVVLGTFAPPPPEDMGLALVIDPLCADGLVVGPEQCDDGNLTEGDGCTTDCEADSDADGFLDLEDLCPSFASGDQSDGNADGIGNVCQCGDADGNFAVDAVDAQRIQDCIDLQASCDPDIADTDGDGLLTAIDVQNVNDVVAAILSTGDLVCARNPDTDPDGDGEPYNIDNCPLITNASQGNLDADSAGDSCDACPEDSLDDQDGDAVCVPADNCPVIANPSQKDMDEDDIGDDCDSDRDGDGFPNGSDTCPDFYNPDQSPNCAFLDPESSIPSTPIVGLKLVGHLLYLANAEATGGLFILDLSEPDNPQLVGTPFDFYGTFGEFPLRLDVEGDRAYVNSTGIPATLEVLDISNPATIASIATVPAPPGGFPVWGTGRLIDAIGERAYWVTSRGLIIVDLSDPNSPTVLGSLAGFGNLMSIRVRGDLVYLLDTPVDQGIFVIDVSDPTTPTIRGQYPTNVTLKSMDVEGPRAYSVVGNGIRIVDISDPDLPTLVASSYVPLDYPSTCEIVGDTLYVTDGVTLGNPPGGKLLALDVLDPFQVEEVADAPFLMAPQWWPVVEFGNELVLVGDDDSLEIFSVADLDDDGILTSAPDLDNCPLHPNANQLDSAGGPLNPLPDGIGDACQCGDVTGEGQVNILDVVYMLRHAQDLGPTLPFPDKCNVIGPPGGGVESCDESDASELRDALAGLTHSASQVCGPATL